MRYIRPVWTQGRRLPQLILGFAEYRCVDLACGLAGHVLGDIVQGASKVNGCSVRIDQLNFVHPLSSGHDIANDARLLQESQPNRYVLRQASGGFTSVRASERDVLLRPTELRQLPIEVR